MIYVILGQTASGKTSLALKLAKLYKMPVISADAYQCYKMMSIGTDLPTRSDVADIEYSFYDEFEPDEEVSVFTFQKECRPLLDKYVKEGRDVIVVGGTLLYIKALLYNYVFEKDEEKVDDYENMPLSEMQDLLLKKDPKTYQEIDNRNPRRVIRALRLIDKGISREEVLEKNDDKPLYPVTFFKLTVDKDLGNKKIDERVDKMFKEGLVEEVKKLLIKYPDNPRSFISIGYQEIIAGLKDNKSQEEMSSLVKIHTHQLAKKQRTFIRNQFKDEIEGTADEVFDLISNNILLKKRTRLVLSDEVMNKIESSSVLFCGLGGVGGLALIDLVRLGFTSFTLIDFDKVDPTNLNRQALYVYGDISKSKTEVAEKRMKEINPLIKVVTDNSKIEDIDSLPKEKYSIIIDCIDFVKGKTSLYQKSIQDNSIFISSMGLGYHCDSTKVKYGKLKDACDPLAKSFKDELIKDQLPYQDIDCIYASDGKEKNKSKVRANDKTIGSIATVPQAGGLAIISLLLKILKERN